VTGSIYLCIIVERSCVEIEPRSLVARATRIRPRLIMCSVITIGRYGTPMINLKKFLHSAFILLCCSTSAHAATECAKFSPYDCYERHLNECIIEWQQSKTGVGWDYTCRAPRNECEMNWPHTVWDYKDTAALTKYRNICGVRPGCKFREPGCICSGDLRGGPDYGKVDCECGGGLPAGCVKAE
jgi:hypothetical protein